MTLRTEIEQVLAEGAALGSPVPHLTSRDDSALKRHPSVAVADIDFQDGEMHFLGLKVVKGESSQLERVPA
ncbi:MAG: hypothetical protein CGW95_04330 [Phenylobacterium zucineum]|nr:MAG: hypothetical protein CGW95_04330 [Phenylobacterium zucineum]